MNFARAHNTYLEPPEDDPICEDGCGQSLERSFDGDWVCGNLFCPSKFDGVEKAMAEALVDALDSLDTYKHKCDRLSRELRHLQIALENSGLE